LNQRDRAIELLRQRSVLRLTVLAAAGVHASTVTRLVAYGALIRVARGVYELADAAVGAKDRMPKVTHIGVRVVRFSATARVLGVGDIVIDGVTVRITSPARTIVDCFRYRRIVGLDIAMEALRMGVRADKARPADIAQLATDLRIATVIRPYLEAIAADDT
jgi:predicted transcriptional regulator of viral defense system